MHFVHLCVYNDAFEHSIKNRNRILFSQIFYHLKINFCKIFGCHSLIYYIHTFSRNPKKMHLQILFIWPRPVERLSFHNKFMSLNRIVVSLQLTTKIVQNNCIFYQQKLFFIRYNFQYPK